MTLQALIVMMLVSMCSGYALWTLMPSFARRAVAAWLLGFKPPRFLAAPLAMAAAAPGASCACSGCERAAPAAPVGSAQPLRFHSRSKP